MWKLLIADDEPRIRSGLRKALNWEEKGVTVAGEAENGIEALEAAQTIRPDLMFVDINMPLLNGLDLIERLKDVLPGCLIIVITGHDEFSYAQRAVRLKVFDYLLKPVQRAELDAVVGKALETLQTHHSEQTKLDWIQNRLEQNTPYLREEFMRAWVAGTLPAERAEAERRYYRFDYQGPIGLLLAKPLGWLASGSSGKEWDPALLEFAVKNIVGDLLPDKASGLVFSAEKGWVGAVTPFGTFSLWTSMMADIERKVEHYLGVSLLIVHTTLEQAEGIPQAFADLKKELLETGALTPVVLAAKKYMETYYYKEDLSLAEVADSIRVNPNYLSKLLKKELGRSFIDLLTGIRMRKAILYLQDPTAKIYDIAEKVGYNTQHYFSHIFKKTTGMSPLEYRRFGERR